MKRVRWRQQRLGEREPCGGRAGAQGVTHAQLLAHREDPPGPSGRVLPLSVGLVAGRTADVTRRSFFLTSWLSRLVFVFYQELHGRQRRAGETGRPSRVPQAASDDGAQDQWHVQSRQSGIGVRHRMCLHWRWDFPHTPTTIHGLLSLFFIKFCTIRILIGNWLVE